MLIEAQSDHYILACGWVGVVDGGRELSLNTPESPGKATAVYPLATPQAEQQRQKEITYVTSLLILS